MLFLANEILDKISVEKIEKGVNTMLCKLNERTENYTIEAEY